MCSGWSWPEVRATSARTWIPSKASVEHRSLRELVAQELLRDFIRQVGLRKAELMEGNGLFPFSVERLELRAREPRGVELHAEVRLSAEVVDAMDGYRVWVGTELIADVEAWQPAEPVDEGLVRYELSCPLPDLTAGDWIRLEIRDGALKQNVRTFTLRGGQTGRSSRRALQVDWPLNEH